MGSGVPHLSDVTFNSLCFTRYSGYGRLHVLFGNANLLLQLPYLLALAHTISETSPHIAIVSAQLTELNFLTRPVLDAVKKESLPSRAPCRC